jgi:hypothetical protein
VSELNAQEGGADQFVLPSMLKDYCSEIQRTLHSNLPGQISQPEGLPVPVPATLSPVEHVLPARPRRHMRLIQVRVRVHADRDVTRVQKQHGCRQRFTGSKFVRIPLRPHRLLTSTSFNPEPAVPVVRDRAGPKPTIIRLWPLTTKDQNRSTSVRVTRTVRGRPCSGCIPKSPSARPRGRRAG